MVAADTGRTAVVLDSVEQVRGGDDPQIDGWAQQIFLPVDDTGWAGSTFVATSEELPAGTVVVDDTHKGDTAEPYILLTVAPSVTRDCPLDFFTWELAEKPRMSRSLFRQTVRLVSR